MHLKSFIKNSSIIFASTLIGGVFSFAFHPFVARFISLRDFAELQALLSLSSILGVPAATLGFIITRYISKFYAHHDFVKIKQLAVYFSKKALGGGLILFILFLLASPWIADYLKIDSFALMAMTGLIMAIGLIGGIFGPMFQGMQKFMALGVLGIVGALARFAFGVGLVLLFKNIYGALGGILIAGILSVLIAFGMIRNSLKNIDITSASEAFAVKDYRYYLHTFFIALFLVAFPSLDILLVKNIFTIEVAGLYAAAAILAKAVIVAASALEGVMFPVVIAKHEKKDDFLIFFLKSSGILLLGLLFSVGLFYKFGEVFILLMGSKYALAGPYLWQIGIFASLFALINYLVKFLLAIKKTGVVYLLAVGSALQIALGYRFSGNLHEFIRGMSYAMLVTLVLLVAYCVKNKKTLLVQHPLRRE